MRRVLALAVLACLAGSPALADSWEMTPASNITKLYDPNLILAEPLSATPEANGVVRVPPWVLPGAGLDFDFAHNRYWQRGRQNNPALLLTTARASTKYCDDLSGLWHLTANNTLCATNKGALIEEARTNVVLWDRDLTNAAWTATNVTVALNQTGIAGQPNAASSLTATGANGTVLQAITLASSARFQSAFVRRITGSGTVNMTMDNGVTWTAITPCAATVPLGSAACRVTIPTQTLANPTVGFRLVTSGDAIAVDFVQNENSGSFATSPILITSAAATRAADVVNATKAPVFGSAYTLFAKGTPIAPTGYAARQVILEVDAGSSQRSFLSRESTTAVGGAFSVGGAGVNIVTAVAWGASSSGKIAAAFAPADQALIFNAGAAASVTAATLPTTPTSVVIGNQINSALPWNGYVERASIQPSTRLSNAALQGRTTP